MLNHNLNNLFEQAVADNSEWLDHVESYSRIGDLAMKVNAPGNDVFVSKDVAIERQRLHAALDEYEKVAQDIARDISTLNESTRTRFVEAHARVDEHMNAMARQAEETFTSIEQGREDVAATQMAVMDRIYSELLTAMRALNKAARLELHQSIIDQSDTAHSQRYLEIALAAAAVLMVGGAVLYGHHILREIRAAEHDREARNNQLEALNQELTFQRDALDQAAIVSATDAMGRITYVNDNFTAISGYTREELLGNNHRMINSGAHSKLFWKEMFEAMSRKGIWHGVICNRAKDGSLYWVKSTNVAFRDDKGRIDRYMSIRIDITEQIRLENALREAKGEAENASKAKTEFLAHMSHEIRTPLNGVAGMLDLIAHDSLNEQQQRYLEIAQNSATNLSTVINDILDYSRIEEGKLTVASNEFNLLETVETIVQTQALRAQEKGLEITCRLDTGFPEVVRGDVDRVRQILANLIGNAIKFTSNGSVSVRGELEKNNPIGPMVRFTVTDTGIGIPADKLCKLFQAFTQVDSSRTRKFGGTGLGLVICKRLSELMGGTVGVSSNEGRGSMFWFTVQFESPANPVPPRRPDLSMVRLLTVGGTATQRDHVCELVGAWSVRARQAHDLPTALKLIREGAEAKDDYTIAVIDSDSIGADPLQFVHEVCEQVPGTRAKFILLHPISSSVNAQQVEQAGFVGTLHKPLRQSRLLDMVMNIVGKDVLTTNSASSRENSRVSASLAETPLRVLIAEDNEVNQIVTREILADAGHSCRVVGNGQLAVDAVRNDRGSYDVVLMDCQMPILDGLQATREIRRLELAHQFDRQYGRLPIIALTASALRSDQGECMQAGMDAFAMKPINPSELIQVIKNAVQRAQSMKPVQSATPSLEQSARPQAASRPVGSEKHSLPPLILEDFADHCLGDKSLAAQMLDSFEQQLPREMQEIEQWVADGDAIQVAAVAHALKSAAWATSATCVEAIAGNIETYARQRDIDALASAMNELRTEVDRFMAYLPTARTAISTWEAD